MKTLVSSEILSDTFEEGDIVEKGQLLYTLDSSDASTGQTQAQNSYSQAQASYNRAVEAKYPTADMSGTVSEVYVQNGDSVLAVPSGAVNRGNTVLITSDSPSASNALEQEAPEGYVYVRVETGVSDDSYTEITSGLQEGDTVAYIAVSGSSNGMSMMMPGGGGMPSGGGGMPGGGGSIGGF